MKFLYDFQRSWCESSHDFNAMSEMLYITLLHGEADKMLGWIRYYDYYRCTLYGVSLTGRTKQGSFSSS